ncbi:Eco57I restriction-modification methylase domain-containing protein [Hymenobacter cellulosivorans]|uniref:N-6 DNA methylase n=1 Tax=Hymenobacter cellulosivorans TaxID=2932249 RepID=A0ABY4F9Q0_9BACT|nr:N-6 DNA methylase [Hymenobacter cellulosivorans]UOQ53395.1 N-6 DNA methylase [Hymenobacter cellulosivorans]
MNTTANTSYSSHTTRPSNSIDSELIERSGAEYYSGLQEEYRKLNGIVYTPFWLTKHIVSIAITQWKKFNNNRPEPQKASDLSCGTGIFIAELYNQTRALGWSTKVIGKDVDPNAIAFAKEIFTGLVDNIQLEVKDTLFYNNTLFDEQEKYDLIVGNPPYVNSSVLNKKYKKSLSENYITAKSGAFDLSIVYIEKIINSLNDGGVASIILSNKFMSSAYGKEVTKLLSTQCNIIKIEDFHDIQVFEGFTTYTCILTFMKGKPSKRFTLRRYIDDIDHSARKIPAFVEETILSEKLAEHPWNFCSPIEDEIIKICCKKTNPGINDIFQGIQQGIRTSANDVYVIGENQTQEFEHNILRPFIGGEDIKGLEVTHVGNYILYPYKEQEGKIVAFTEKELSFYFPKAFDYLLRNKEKLSLRSLQGNSNWYEFGRSQSLDIVSKKKILVREMMPNAVFSVDLEGQYVFSSGYAIDVSNLKPEVIRAWAAIMATPIMEFVMRHVGTQLHSGWFRLMKHHLEALKYPALSDEILSSIAKDTDLNSIKSKNRVNDIVSKSFGLEQKHVDYINDYLAKIHLKSKPKSEKTVENNKYEPVKLERFNKYHVRRDDLRKEVTFSPNKKEPIHNWYKYTQGFSSNLVNNLLKHFKAGQESIILDPFNGCGTTVTTCAYNGINSIGVEISPLMCLVAKAKSRKWNSEKLKLSIKNIETTISNTAENEVYDRIFEDYFQKAYAPEILKQLNIISSMIKDENDEELKEFFAIGLLSIMEDVSKIRKHGSHYRFLDNVNSVGLQKLNISVIKDSANIYTVFSNKLVEIANDVFSTGGNPAGIATILNESALHTSLEDSSVDFVITSPPYLNRNNYIAQQKAELDILGIIKDKKEYTKLVKSSFRSHTDSELNFKLATHIPEVDKIISSISLEEGNNPKIPHMICGYFQDLDDSLAEVMRVLRKGGKAAFVVGNTRWGGIVVPIDHILALLAEKHGFIIEDIFITRLKGNSPQQMKKYGKIAVRESIVIFKK